MQIKAIHQFSPSCGKGDGVSNGMFFTRSLLRELGFSSDIYCELVQDGLEQEVKQLSELNLSADDLLLVHHSLGYEGCAWLDKISAKKILIYHNITPPQFLPNNGLPELSVLGRKQLHTWMPGYLGAIGDSDLNSEELRAAGYPNIASIPLLVDVERMHSVAADTEMIPKLAGAHNILFVGRFCEHKHQLQLIQMLEELRQMSAQPVRLILAGGITSLPYHDIVCRYVREHGLQEQVILPGKVSDAVLAALYRSADAYVSMSEHEGFGMPLIEAMLHDVPVLARAGSGISATMGEGGILLDPKDGPMQVAAALHTLLTEPALRRKVIAAQRRNLQRFNREHLQRQLSAYLSSVGVEIPKPLTNAAPPAAPWWQIEGPFDSSYSLAIVNRELARALQQQDCVIGLRSREGHGDFAANAEFLKNNADLAAMQAHSGTTDTLPDVVMRNCYPPRLDDMQGRVRAIQSYGWEESGFPAEYVNEFNRKLDLVTVVSRFVGKVLRDNGVRIPIAVVGNGMDHVLSGEAELPVDEITAGWRSFRFLHVSSCFPRKGPDALLAAYGKAFRSSDDVTLIIKTFPNQHNDVRQQLQGLQEQDAAYPHVVVIDQDYSHLQLAGLYQSCHTLVAPSRGEGFGLPIAEAMLLNLPVITTAWSGQLDFCDDSTAWMCNYHFAKSGSHFGGTHSVWADPDVEELSELMLELRNSTEEQRRIRTDAARQRVLQHHRWKNVAERTRSAISALERQPLLRKEPKIGWLSTWNARCGVASYSSFLTTGIPADRMTILSSHIPERIARDAGNVVRCWVESKQETLDNAYTEIIERGIEAVVIQYNFGFFTLVTLAAFIRRLKQAGIAVHIFFHATADTLHVDEVVSLSAIPDALALADRLYVHGVDDLNRLKQLGLVDNVVFFPQGLMATLDAPRLPANIAHRVNGKRVLAAYGFLLPHKGMQALILAFEQLATRDAQLHLLMLTSLYPAGVSEKEFHDCHALIQKLGLAARVTIVSDYLSDEDCQRGLQTAELIVYPYQKTQESSSAAVRMGLASGKPVAVTPLSIFDDVADAVHILPGTEPDELARGIAALLEDKQALASKATQAKAWTTTRQWPALSLRLLNLIDGIANALDDDTGRI